jgi:hypothetical protein
MTHEQTHPVHHRNCYSLSGYIRSAAASLGATWKLFGSSDGHMLQEAAAKGCQEAQLVLLQSNALFLSHSICDLQSLLGLQFGLGF